MRGEFFAPWRLRAPRSIARARSMQPSVAERIARIRELCTALDAARDDLVAVIMQSEALSHEAGLLAADAAEAVERRRREHLRLTRPPSSADHTPGSEDN